MKIEQALAKLEEITAKLERGELPLDEAIGLFEEGLALAAATKAAVGRGPTPHRSGRRTGERDAVGRAF